METDLENIIENNSEIPERFSQEKLNVFIGNSRLQIMNLFKPAFIVSYYTIIIEILSFQNVFRQVTFSCFKLYVCKHYILFQKYLYIIRINKS